MSEQVSATHRVVVPQDNVSDDHYLLLAWAAPAGGDIATGDVLGEFETSKSIFELPAEHSGVFYPLAQEGTHVAVGQIVAVIAERQLTDNELGALGTVVNSRTLDPKPVSADDDIAAEQPPEDAESAQAANLSGARFSKAAEALITQHGIERSHFAGFGLVRGSDVERHLAGVSTRNTAAGSDQRLATSPSQVRGAAIVIVGAGGHARMILDLLAELRCFQVVGLLDDAVAPGQLVNGAKVLGPATAEQFAELHGQGLRLAVNAVGGVTKRPLRAAIYDRIRAAGFGLPTLVHPKAAVDASAQLGEGAQVLAGAYVGASSVIGDDCIINNGSVIAHDCTVADHAHIAPGAVLAGGVTIGRNTLIGMGASIYLGVTIGADVIVANGVDVFAGVQDGAVVRRTHQ